MENGTNHFRCNGCGHNHTEPAFCNSCHSPICPECGRPNQIVNLTAMARIVSDTVPTGKPKVKRKVTTPKDKKSKLASLLERTNEMEREKKNVTHN